MPQHQIAVLPPGQASLDWLSAALGSLKRDDPLQAVTVFTPSPYLAAVLRREVARIGAANVSFSVQLRPVAERIARTHGSRAFDRPLTGPLEVAAVRVALRASAGATLQPLVTNPALQTAFAVLFRDVAHLGTPEVFLTERRTRRSPR
jgi:hypothetical protein